MKQYIPVMELLFQNLKGTEKFIKYRHEHPDLRLIEAFRVASLYEYDECLQRKVFFENLFTMEVFFWQVHGAGWYWEPLVESYESYKKAAKGFAIPNRKTIQTTRYHKLMRFLFPDMEWKNKFGQHKMVDFKCKRFPVFFL